MATVSLKNIGKSFGNVSVIRGVNVEIADGEFIVIVGPSGCGKSTLLRLVAGLERVNEGEVLIGTERMNDVEPMDRDIAMVFQNYALYPHMSVRRNMAYGLKIAGMPKSEIDTRVNEAATLLQLADYLERKPKDLSGGQRQRVAMGRAIVRNPSVFLFDEPLSNLDAKLRVAMRVEIRELQARLNVTTLYVTHDQIEAMTMADRMIVMNDGVVEQIGSPLEVYERPQTLFTAQFIGSPAMNILPGEIVGHKIILEDGNEIARCDLADGSVNVGIRPEHLIPDPKGKIELTPTLVEPLGANTLIHGTINPNNTPLTACVTGVHKVSQDTNPLRYDVAAQDIHLFHETTGQRIEAAIRR